jgi:hypothetical protein
MVMSVRLVRMGASLTMVAEMVAMANCVSWEKKLGAEALAFWTGWVLQTYIEVLHNT